MVMVAIWMMMVFWVRFLVMFCLCLRVSGEVSYELMFLSLVD